MDMRRYDVKFCSRCGDEIDGKIKYMIMQRPIAIFCSWDCQNNFDLDKKQMTALNDSEYRKGYNAAIDNVLHDIEFTKKYYQQQFYTKEETAIGALLRDLRFKYLKE